jgi:hypothetical protein
VVATPLFGRGVSGVVATPLFGRGVSGVVATPLAYEIAIFVSPIAMIVITSDLNRFAVRDMGQSPWVSGVRSKILWMLMQGEGKNEGLSSPA